MLTLDLKASGGESEQNSSEPSPYGTFKIDVLEGPIMTGSILGHRESAELSRINLHDCRKKAQNRAEMHPELGLPRQRNSVFSVFLENQSVLKNYRSV